MSLRQLFDPRKGWRLSALPWECVSSHALLHQCLSKARSVRASPKGQVQRWQITAELESSWGSSLPAVAGGCTALNHLGRDAGPLASKNQKSSSCVACPGIGEEVTTKTRVVAGSWLVSDLVGLRRHYLHIGHLDNVSPSYNFWSTDKNCGHSLAAMESSPTKLSSFKSSFKICLTATNHSKLAKMDYFFFPATLSFNCCSILHTKVHLTRQTCWDNCFTLQHLTQGHWTLKLVFCSVSVLDLCPAYSQNESVSYVQPWRNDLAFTREEMVNFLPRRRGRSCNAMTHWEKVGMEVQKTPSAAEQLGNPTAASALGSWEPEVPAVALQGQNEKPAAVSDWSCCQALFTRKALQILAWGLVETGGEGWAPRALSHSSVLKDFKQCTFTKTFSLFKVAFACQLLNHIQPSGGKSRLSRRPFMGEEYW